jgi:catechol 2,3-dioxygenase-like lactoylglutathione lyase family enzyme
MLSYITIGARDTEQATAFYDAVLGTIGYKRFADYGTFIGYGIDGKSDGQSVWICKPFDGNEARAGNGIMVAFAAASRAQVDAFHDAAMKHGGSDEGAPGLRESYGPNWYAAYLRDPTGNKLAAVYNKAA